MGPLPAGPHAKSIWLLLIRRDRHSAGKPKPSSWYRQTLWPLGSTSLSSSLLAGATPWTSKVKAYASGSGNEKRLRATTKPPSPLKSKSSRMAPPRGPRSREMSSCACPDATGVQAERSAKSSRVSPFMSSRRRRWTGRRASDVPRDRAVVRGRAAGEVERRLVDVAPSPTFGRVVAFDDRMAGRVEVLGGVMVRRAVAAADVAARPTEPQMHPDRIDLQALLAAERAGDDRADAGPVGTFVSHWSSRTRRETRAASRPPAPLHRRRRQRALPIRRARRRSRRRPGGSSRAAGSRFR